MPTKEQKDRVETLLRYVFFAAFIAMVLAFLLLMVTKNRMLSVRIGVTALWSAFATGNAMVFYTGRISWKNGPKYSREQSSGAFYTSAILFATASMGIATFMLWEAYTSE